MIILIWFAFKHQKNIFSRHAFIVSLSFDVIILGTIVFVVLLILISQKCCRKCCNDCYKCCYGCCICHDHCCICKCCIDRCQAREEESEDVTKSDDDTFLVPPPLSLFCPCCCRCCRKQLCQENRQQEQQMLISGHTVIQENEDHQAEQGSGQNEDWSDSDESIKQQNCIHCCVQCCTHSWTIITNTISLITFIASLSYLTQALPAIAISYYISPPASLIKLGFFELAIIILVVEISFFLYLVDKCVWLSYVHCAKKIPDEVYEEEEITDKAPPPSESDLTSGLDTSNAPTNPKRSPQDLESDDNITNASPDSATPQQPKKKKIIKYIDQYLVDKTKPKLISFGHGDCSSDKLFCKRNWHCLLRLLCETCHCLICPWKLWYCHCLLYVSVFQIAVAMLLIGMSAPLLYFIMNIIIDQTSTSNDQFKDILAIIPTIALNTWLLIRYGNISHFVKDIMGKATKSAMEYHDSHHDHHTR